MPIHSTGTCMCYMGGCVVCRDVKMKLFEEEIKIKNKELKAKEKMKKCCKCGNESNNTILYTEKEIICMNCYCELIAKDRR